MITITFTLVGYGIFALRALIADECDCNHGNHVSAYSRVEAEVDK